MTYLAPLLVVLLVLLPHHARAASFTPLGDLQGGPTISSGAAISADGSVVVGNSWDATGSGAFRWSGGSMSRLGPTASAGGVSADGSIVVGQTSGDEAFRWSGGTLTRLGFLGSDSRSFATGVSANGGVVVGESLGPVAGGQAFRWVDSPVTDMVGLGFLPNHTRSTASGVTPNGEVVVGTSFGSATGAAFRWSGGVMSSLSEYPEWVLSSEAAAVSADGAFVVGSMSGVIGTIGGYTAEEAFRWTEGEMLGLGHLFPGRDYAGSSALGVSADGVVVVGSSLTPTGGAAFVWTESGGMQSLIEVLAANGVSGLEGWQLFAASAVSADGRWVTGSGLNPDGNFEGFLANISPVPEPSAAWLIGSSLAALVCARRRSAA